MDHNPLTRLLEGIDPGRRCLAPDHVPSWTYGDLLERSAALAGALRSAGVGTGERVVVQVEKSPDAVALYLACLRLGAVYVPLNPAYTPAEVAFFVEDAAPAVFVGTPGSSPSDGTAPSDAVTLTLGRHGEGTLPEAAATADLFDAVEARAEDDWAAMLYTSGTTGRPKGAMLSCENLVSNARALVDAWRFEPGDVLLHALPIFHVHGLFVALHCALAVGAAIRLHERFDLDAVVGDLAASTVFMGVPTHYHRLLTHPDLDRSTTAGMRLFTSGSAPLPAHEHTAFAERTGHRIVERYGMTETMILTSNPYDGERVPGTVGFALDGIDLRVADDGDAAVPAGGTGTIEVRGPSVFLGYWGLPERTAGSFRDDGWFVTGDIGTVDPEGRVTLVGRASDLIISGGFNVYPKEVEAVLDRVDGVDESAVLGVPDPDLGETVVAALVVHGAAPDEEALRDACDRHLARFKHPRRYVVVEALPRNAMGKVQKTELRAALADSGTP